MPMEPIAAKIGFEERLVDADRPSTPNTAIRTEDYPSLQPGSGDVNQPGIATPKWLDQQLRDPVTTSTAPAVVENAEDLIDFGGNEHIEPKVTKHHISTDTMPEAVRRTSPFDPPISTVTPRETKSNLTIQTVDEEHMPLVKYSISPSPSSTTRGPDQLPSVQFEKMGMKIGMTHKTESSAACRGNPSPTQEGKTNKSLSDPTAFIAAYNSVCPSFASKWGTRSKSPSLVASPTGAGPSQSDHDEEVEDLEEGEVVEEEPEAAQTSAYTTDYPKPLFSYEDEVELGEVDDIDQPCEKREEKEEVGSNETKSAEADGTVGGAGLKTLQEYSMTAEKTNKEHSGTSASKAEPGATWLPASPRLAPHIVRAPGHDYNMASTGAVRSPTGTRILGGDLDEACKKMVLSPGGGSHALEMERNAVWKPVPREEGDEDKVYFVLDPADGW